MTWRGWQNQEERIVQTNYQEQGAKVTARELEKHGLKRSIKAVLVRAGRMGLSSPRRKLSNQIST